MSCEFIRGERTSDITYIGPFCGRALLETSLTAVLARIDPFRVFLVHGFQTNESYKLHRRNSAAINWASDIFVDDEKVCSKDDDGLFGPNVKLEKLSRALFSPYVDKIYWESAAQKFIDLWSGKNVPPLVEEIARGEPSKFIPIMKTMSSRLYSSLSKGVHIEFVIPMESKFDAQTIIDNLDDIIKVIIGLSSVSHFIETSQLSLSAPEVESIVGQIQERVYG